MELESPGAPPVQLTLNATAAQLLARLTVELGSDDPSSVVLRALGLFELAQRTRRHGGRIVFESERGDRSEVAF